MKRKLVLVLIVVMSLSNISLGVFPVTDAMSNQQLQLQLFKMIDQLKMAENQLKTATNQLDELKAYKKEFDNLHNEIKALEGFGFLSFLDSNLKLDSWQTALDNLGDVDNITSNAGIKKYMDQYDSKALDMDKLGKMTTIELKAYVSKREENAAKYQYALTQASLEVIKNTEKKLSEYQENLRKGQVSGKNFTQKDYEQLKARIALEETNLSNELIKIDRLNDHFKGEDRQIKVIKDMLNSKATTYTMRELDPENFFENVKNNADTGSRSAKSFSLPPNK